jgi:hypothetical protein
MALPDWIDPGLLPVGRHRATIDELYERCVLDAPNQDRREELFMVLRTFIDITRRIIGAATLWIDGGFVTSKPAPPFDIDLLIIPADWAQLNTAAGRDRDRIYGLLTLQDIIVGHPLYLGFERIQPFAGELDSFLCYPGQEADWDLTWSAVKWNGVLVPGMLKGYVEVSN